MLDESDFEVFRRKNPLEKSASGALTGALGGAGLGLLVQALRPKDKDQSQWKEYLISALTGAGLGGAAGFAYDNLGSNTFKPGPSQPPSKEKSVAINDAGDGVAKVTPSKDTAYRVTDPEKLAALTASAQKAYDGAPDSPYYTYDQVWAPDFKIDVVDDGKGEQSFKPYSPFPIVQEIVDGLYPGGFGSENAARKLQEAANNRDVGFMLPNGDIVAGAPITVNIGGKPVEVIYPDGDMVLSRHTDGGFTDRTKIVLKNVLGDLGKYVYDRAIPFH